MRYNYYRDEEWVLSPIQNTKQMNTECYRRQTKKVDKGGLTDPLQHLSRQGLSYSDSYLWNSNFTAIWRNLQEIWDW
jgi:hypothetical protein